MHKKASDLVNRYQQVLGGTSQPAILASDPVVMMPEMIDQKQPDMATETDSDASSQLGFGITLTGEPVLPSLHQRRWARAIALAETCSITPATPPPTPGSPKYRSLDDLVAVCKFLRNLGCKIEETQPAQPGGQPGLRISKPDKLASPEEWEQLDSSGKRVGGAVVTMLPPFRAQLKEVLARLATEERQQRGRERR